MNSVTARFSVRLLLVALTWTAFVETSSRGNDLPLNNDDPQPDVANPNNDPPYPPSRSASMFTVPDDLELTQVLAEPIVAQPVSISFDERGRMWIVQYLQYPHPAGVKMLSHDNVWRAVYDKVPPAPPNHFPGADKITIHEDVDGDGAYETHKTFVEGLNIATSCARGRGGVWVLNPPYLLFYPDRNNDDVPDGDPVVHLSGFGLEDTHSVANSLCWGPDGWLYAAQGSTVSGDVLRPGLDKVPVHSMGQLIWRYHPETKRYEIFAEGGGNAFGCEIDAKGRIFSGHNGGDTRGFHYVQGGYSQKGFGKHGPLSNPFAFGYFSPMKHPTVPRFTHCFAIYEGGAFPAAHQGKLFGVAPLQSHVVESEIWLDGSTFQTNDVGFPITSADNWFKPVHVTIGPDGALYIADWYDGQVNHYRNHEGQIDTKNGRIYRLAAKGARPEKHADLSQFTSLELVERLKHDNRWQRFTALRLLGDRRDKTVVPLLHKMLADDSDKHGLEALWALHLCGGLDEATALATSAHPDPHVRLWAVRLACDERQVTSSVAERLAEMAHDEPNIEVRSQLACSARRLPAADGLPVIAALLAHSQDANDPHLPLLLWWAIETHAESDRDAVLSMFAKAPIYSLPLVEQHILHRLMRRYAQSGTRRDLLTCAELFRQSPSPAATQRMMTGFEEAFVGRSFAGLPDELIEAVAQAGGGSLVLQVRRGDAAAIDEALARIGDENAPQAERVQFAQVFGEFHQPKSVSVLLAVARTSADQEVRKAALAALQRYDDPTIGKEIVSLHSTLPDDVREVAQSLLSSRPTWSLALLSAVESGQIKSQEIPLPIVRKMLLKPNEEIAVHVRKLWGSVEGETTADMRATIERLAEVVQTGEGNPYEGKKLFTNNCGKCHTLFGEGGQTGPDLTSYKRDDLETMLLNIVNPSAEVREGFENHLVITSDGRTINGLLVDKDNQIVVLRGADGQNLTIPRDEIEEMNVVPLSIMPEGALKDFNDQQVCDLFAYLRSTQPLVFRDLPGRSLAATVHGR